MRSTRQGAEGAGMQQKYQPSKYGGLQSYHYYQIASGSTRPALYCLAGIAAVGAALYQFVQHVFAGGALQVLLHLRQAV